MMFLLLAAIVSVAFVAAHFIAAAIQGLANLWFDHDSGKTIEHEAMLAAARIEAARRGA